MDSFFCIASNLILCYIFIPWSVVVKLVSLTFLRIFDYNSVKRSFTPVKFDSNEPQKKGSKTEQKIYAPPGGKFSDKAGNFPGIHLLC